MMSSLAARAQVGSIRRNESARSRAHLVSSAKSGKVHKLGAEQRVMINQPLDAVLRLVSTGDQASRIPDLERSTTQSTDPIFRQSHTFLGRRVEVRYTFYAIPGGTQVTAVVEEEASNRGDAVGILAARASRRQIEADLSALKGALE